MTKFLLLLGVLLSVLQLSAQTPAEIIKKSEEARRGIESSYAEMTMTIVRPTWQRAMSLKSWSEGDDNALILVTAPARDKGMATLKRRAHRQAPAFHDVSILDGLRLHE